MIGQIARGLGFVGDPLPGPGEYGTLSRGGGYTNLGSIALVASMGRYREATYRTIYLTNPWVYSAVEVQAVGIGRLPLHIFELDEKARKQRVRGDVPLTPGRPTGGQSLDRLLSLPQAGVSRNAIYGGTIRDRRIHGNALWEIQRFNGSITGLVRRPWRRVVRVEQIDDNGLCQYEIRKRGTGMDTYWLSSNDVIHFGYWTDPESPVAPSLLESCRYTLALHDAVVRHLIAYFGNAMRPSGQLSVENLTREKAALIREIMTEAYASPENAGKILVTEGKFESMTGDIANAQVAELLDKSREEIAAAFAIPPPVLGILDRAIKSNVKELREQYVRDSLGPLAADFEQELQAQLLPQQPSWSSLFVEFQLAEQLRPDLEARALVYQRLMPVYTIDEIRAFENASALDIAGVTDVPWVPSGAMPLTQAAVGRVPRAPVALADDLRAAVEAGRARAEDVEPVLVALAAANGNGAHAD